MSTGKLFIGPEGFVDLRKNPPATTVTVQGGITAPEPAKLVETLPEPPAEVKDEALPGRQKTAEGLQQSVAGPVAVKKYPKRTNEVRRIEASDGSGCYAIVTRNAWNRLGRHKYFGTRTGHLYRKIRNKWTGIEEVIWLHREIKHCNLPNKYIAFLDGDQRNLLPSNTKIVNSKEEAKAIRMAALKGTAHA